MAEDRRVLDAFSVLQSDAPFPVVIRIEGGGTASALLTASAEHAAKLPLVTTQVRDNTLFVSYTGQHTSASSFSASSFSGGQAFAGGAAFASSGENVSIINGVVYRNGQRVDPEAGGNATSFSGTMPDIRITLTTPALRSIHLSGVGSVTTEVSELAEPDLEVKVTGTGQVTLPAIRADTVRATLSGTGQIKLAGTARNLSVGLSGTGQLDAVALPVEEADVNVSGTGQAKVNVARRLSGAITGVGAIGYKGDPQVDVSKSFTGRLYRIP